MAVLCTVFPAFAIFSWSQENPRDDELVITAAEIKALKVVRISDVLSQMPGIQAGDSTVAIFGSYKVKVLLDGRPINDPTSAMNNVKWDMVPLEQVESIRVLRGKGSMEYGDDASGGVILITTRKIDRFSGNLKAYGGNYETWSTSVNSGFTSGILAGSLSGSWDSTEGYLLNNDKEKRRAGAKIALSPREKTSLTLSADLLDEAYGLSGSRNYPTPFSRVDAYLNSLAFQIQDPLGTSKTNFIEGERRNTDISRNLDQTIRIKQAEQEFATTVDGGDWGDISLGAGFNWGQADSSEMEEKSETDLSLFASDSYAFAAWPLNMTVGIRATEYSEFTGTINPELKVIWKEKAWNITTAYSKANNIPSFHQRYNRTTSMLPNPDLQMETSDNYSLTLFHQIDDISVSTSVFYNSLSDRITYVREQGIGQYVNFGEVTYKGGDLSVNWKITSMLTAKAAYTYLEAKDEQTGLWLPAKARHTANGTLILSPLTDLTLVAGLTSSSSVYTDSANTESVSSYLLGNLRGEYKFDRYIIFTEVKNISDVEYYYSDNILAPPRTWLIGINVLF